MSHKCPVPDCPKIIDNDDVMMCLQHWRAVPKQLQNEVWRTWKLVKKVLRDGEPINAGYHKNLQLYNEARRKAIEAI